MEKKRILDDQFELLTQSHGRHLLISVLKRDLNAFKGTRFQFIHNHPLIRQALEHLLNDKN